MKTKIKINDKFNNLTVLGRHICRTGSGKVLYICSCVCGEIIRTTACKLTSGRKKSCGCLRKFKTKHIHYSRAESIYNRCNSPGNKEYHIYKNKNKIGNTWDICLALEKVPGFFVGAQIDRIDNNGDYTIWHPEYGDKVYEDVYGRPCIGNLRWVSPADNLMNTSRNVTMESLKTIPRQCANIKRALKLRGMDICEFDLVFICLDNSKNKLYIVK